MQTFDASHALPVGEHSVPRPAAVLQTANVPLLVATDLQTLNVSALRHEEPASDAPASVSQLM